MVIQCQHCSKQAFYNCIKCQCLACNRPESGTSVPPSRIGISEEHSKQLGFCKNCKFVKRSKQAFYHSSQKRLSCFFSHFYAFENYSVMI